MRRRAAFLSILLPISALAAGCQQSVATPSETVLLAPAPALAVNEGARPQTAIFAGGCFWGVEGVFSHVKGVTSVVSGYQGGARTNASYDRVSTGDTGHAEAVRVTYDPTQVSYGQLLRIFFSVATDPTQRDRQGPDVGTQYRSALVPLTSEQRRIATAYLAQLGKAGLWKQPIVTRIEPASGFYPAEEHHQDFMARNPHHPYIEAWDQPKVAALARLFPTQYKAEFVRN